MRCFSSVVPLQILEERETPSPLLKAIGNNGIVIAGAFATILLAVG